MPGRLGKYEIIKTLGSGGSCKVKLAIDTETGEKVAVKMLKKDIDAKTHSLTMNEVQAMSNLQHKHIIEQKEVGTDIYKKTSGSVERVSYIVLELVLGGELFDFIA